MGAGTGIEVEAVIREILAEGRLYRVELANGHRLTAFVDGRDKKIFAGLNAGDMVSLQLTPYDLSVGRILVETKRFKHESSSVGQKNV